MKKPLKILGLTTTRADYGHLYWPFKSLMQSKHQLKIVVSGTHLLEEHGSSEKLLQSDGFEIADRVSFLSGKETSPLDICMASSKATALFAESFARINPDIVMILGDRYEILSAAQAALLLKIPIAHLAGGDITEGAFDDAIRHAVTKMSHLHFPTNEEAAEKIKQMGEDPKNVFNIGSTGIEYILSTELLSKEELKQELGLNWQKQNLLVTYHPETLAEDTIEHFKQLLSALDKIKTETGIFFTRPNADPLGLEINSLIESFATTNENVQVFANLGSKKYLSLINKVDAVVGNSSSGLYEVPTLKTATVNIGDRQKGRLRANSVIDVEPEANSILEAIKTAISSDCSKVKNPYGDGEASKKLIAVFDELENAKQLLNKKFYTPTQMKTSVALH